MFDGCIVALVTPFAEDGTIDSSALEALAERHLAAGTDGILLAGCTGESFTLSDAERIELFRVVKGVVGDRLKLLVGTGASSTEAAVRRTEAALDAGADGALVITPFGNKPSQHALESYFTEVAAVGMPIVLYNVPSRTGTTIAPQTAVQLAEVENIVAIKEASGSLDAASFILANSDLTLLSGDDALTVPMMSIGASGVISTTANLLPEDFARMVHSAADGDWQLAAKLHLKMFPVMKALFVEGNPVPLKAAMAHLGMLPDATYRAPLEAISEPNRKRLLEALDAYGGKG